MLRAKLNSERVQLSARRPIVASFLEQGYTSRAAIEAAGLSLHSAGDKKARAALGYMKRYYCMQQAEGGRVESDSSGYVSLNRCCLL